MRDCPGSVWVADHALSPNNGGSCVRGLARSDPTSMHQATSAARECAELRSELGALVSHVIPAAFAYGPIWPVIADQTSLTAREAGVSPYSTTGMPFRMASTIAVS